MNIVSDFPIEEFNRIIQPVCYRCYFLFKDITDPLKGYRCHTTYKSCPARLVEKYYKELNNEN